MINPVAGPLPFGQKPEFQVPKGACDCHVHIFGPYQKYPLGDSRSYSPPEAPVEMLLALMDSMSLDRAVVVNGTAYNRDSRILYDALQGHRDRLRGIAVLDPDTTTDAELDRLHAAGVRGIRINLYKKDGKLAYLGGSGMQAFDVLAPRIAERGWHAQVWINVADLPDLHSHFSKVPIDIVVDHMGRFVPSAGVEERGFRLLCDLVAEGNRYWTKISGADRMTETGAPYLDIDPFARALIAANPDRLVWASDWPHVNHAAMPLDVDLLNLVSRWTDDEVVIRKILSDNPQRLYDFDPVS
ncbi:amidohydrolase family protein [Pigmentiphaga litoralis]|uniref:amidohydrolase family protein n=1 Tax=Pigmentiphaga litoralis TaxID=516702 RepID=UPI00389AA42D